MTEKCLEPSYDAVVAAGASSLSRLTQTGIQRYFLLKHCEPALTPSRQPTPSLIGTSTMSPRCR